jgi:predicted  nucleic acid-binding Zn-ribbon protein
LRKIDALWSLQDIDSRAEAALTSAEQLRSQIGVRGTLDEREFEVQQAKAALHTLAAEQRDLELKAEERRAKIAADESKLYGGRVSNPKELQDIEHEVAQDRRQLSPIEDRLIEILDESETASEHIKQLQTELVADTRSWEQGQEQARARLAAAEISVQQLQGRRVDALKQIEPAFLPSYETLRRQKGTAVARVNQRTCQSCRVTLTPVQEQRARQGNDLIMCHSCGRILFVPIG